MKLGLPFSVSILFWYIVGVIRFLSEEIFSGSKRLDPKLLQQKLAKVAVCIPAHNEEIVIARTIKSIKRVLPADQVFVVSDGSGDRTAAIAKGLKVNVLELVPARGKAGALAELIRHFKLLKHYEFILFVDADTLLDKDYLKNAVTLFASDSSVAAIAGYVVSNFRKHKGLSKRKFFEAYRVRLNRLLQLFLVYGQTWKHVNAAPVIPGSCSMYRTRVLKKLQLEVPGILIEDFHLAFQIHKMKLGRIAHHPKIYSIDQDPDNLKDYWNQVKRWNIGYYQTVRKLGLWPSLFWVSLGIFTLEVLGFSLFLVLLPIVAAALLVRYYAPVTAMQFLPDPQVFPITLEMVWQVLIVVVLIDYAFTVLVAIHEKKYKLAIYGLGFFAFQFINAIILLRSVPQGLLTTSAGRWKPPKRR